MGSRSGAERPGYILYDVPVVSGEVDVGVSLTFEDSHRHSAYILNLLFTEHTHMHTHAHTHTITNTHATHRGCIVHVPPETFEWCVSWAHSVVGTARHGMKKTMPSVDCHGLWSVPVECRVYLS